MYSPCTCGGILTLTKARTTLQSGGCVRKTWRCFSISSCSSERSREWEVCRFHSLLIWKSLPKIQLSKSLNSTPYFKGARLSSCHYLSRASRPRPVTRIICYWIKNNIPVVCIYFIFYFQSKRICLCRLSWWSPCTIQNFSIILSSWIKNKAFCFSALIVRSGVKPRRHWRLNYEW